MSQSTNLVSAFEQLATDLFNVEVDAAQLSANLGDIATLQTADKTSAVNAINSIHTRVNSLELDAVTLTQVNSLIATAKTEIMGNVPTAHNTLEKISVEIVDLKSRVTATEQSIGTLQGEMQTLGTSVTALGQNKADKTALEAAESTLSTVESTLAGLIRDDLAVGAVNTYSIDKILEVVSSASASVKQDLLGGAGAAYDTLQELKTFIDDNGDMLTAINGIVANCVSFVSVQALTDEQKVIARTNIMAAGKTEFDALVAALGDLTVNFKQIYLDKKASLAAV